ncbi:MFS transporter [Stutzerimonas stutzeri]|uniref:MFS transporter n=1 Tax=Stutzerimonas sp. S1 TaxID=3030652 RepID=UPI0022244752|nr:MFS transporter [Stutzerimonas sp. S1]MCW3147917.1 MFS transporter [Stutzerimonas sp. S1]
MDALLILGGLLLTLAGLVWLVSLAFGTSLFWGIGSLLPPVTLAYVVRHWNVARKALLLVGLGFIPMIVGLSLLAARDAERLAAIFSMQWLPQKAQPELATQLRGQLNGRAFTPQYGEYIDGVLTLRAGKDFFARQEVSIRLPEQLEGPLALDVLPDDTGNLPEIRLSWLEPGTERPEARRLTGGYTLHLDLQPEAPNTLRGDFHLVLPPHFATSLSGKVELYTNHLRYRDGQVDTQHDSLDTIAYVVKDYLQRRYATRDVQLAPLDDVSLAATRLTIAARGTVQGQEATHELVLLKTAQGWHVEGDNYPPLAAVQAPAKPSAALVEPVVAPPASTLDRRPRFSMDRLLRNPGRYEHLLVRAHTERGGVAEGRFMGLDSEGNLRIRRVISGPGEAYYNLAPGEIVLLELLEP